MKVTHGSLFSGIGGFDLAAEWAGIDNTFHCEINPFGQLILNYYWPDSKLFDNVETAEFKQYKGLIDILSGGFPCQDVSKANQSETGQSGLLGKRTGLFYHKCRAIEEIEPRFVIAENVGNLLTINGGGGILEQYSPNWPEWGTMQNGEFAVHQMSVPPIIGKGCISLLTPTASDYKRDKVSFPMYLKRMNRSAGCLPEHLYKLFGAVPGHVSHLFYAWMMGFPYQWLDIVHHNGEKNKSKPLGMR